MKRILILTILLFLIINISYCQNSYPLNNRVNHNRVNTRKNLLQKYTLDQLSVMISSGNFDDIYVGDYIEMEMTTEISSGNNVTEKVRWLVADIDYFYNKTDSPITAHHIVLLAEDCFTTLHRMNSSNTTANGFAGCEMFTTTLPLYNTAIINAFGNSHILSYHQLLTNSMESSIPSMSGDNYTGASNGWAWTSTTLCLMSEPHVYGTKILSSNYYDVGINNSQFSLFRELPEKICCGQGFNKNIATNKSYWLLSVVNSSRFGRVFNSGHSSLSPSSYANANGLRPYFLFK